MATFPALASIPSPQFVEMVSRACDPVRAGQLNRVRANPKALRRIPAAQAVKVIELINDIDLYAAVSDAGDDRRSVRSSLANHPLRELYLYRRATAPEQYHGVPVADLAVRDLAHACRSTGGRLLGWVRSLPAEQQPEAVLFILGSVELRNYSFDRCVGHILLDVALGLHPGLDLPTLRSTVPAETMRSLTVRAVGRCATGRIVRLDLRTAAALNDLGVLPPAHLTVEQIDRDAAEETARTVAGLVYLAGRSVFTDDELIERADALTGGEIAQLLGACSSARVFNVLGPRIVEHLATGGGERLHGVLRRVGGLDSNVRAMFLRHESYSEVSRFLSSGTANIPRPGEVREIVLDALAGRSAVSSGAVLSLLNSQAGTPSDAWCEGVTAALEHASAKQLLSFDGDIGRLALQRLRERLGDRIAAWEAVATLFDTWAGTIDDLATTAALL